MYGRNILTFWGRFFCHEECPLSYYGHDTGTLLMTKEASLEEVMTSDHYMGSEFPHPAYDFCLHILVSVICLLYLLLVQIPA